jgi:hypothetical protein
VHRVEPRGPLRVRAAGIVLGEQRIRRDEHHAGRG